MSQPQDLDSRSTLASGVWMCTVAYIFHLLISAVYNLFFSPLSKYPGPFLSKISSLPSFYHALKADRHIWFWQNIEIYGEKFRAGPNLVIFSSPQANRAIYSGRSNVKKAKFYDAWKRNEHDLHTLNTTDVALHAQKRYALSQAFTPTSVRSAAPFIIGHVDRWIWLLMDNPAALRAGGNNWTEPKNVADWNDRLTFDVMADLSFGRSCDIKEPGENPFKVIPHAIVNYLQFFYPSSDHHWLSKSPFLALFVALKPWGLEYEFRQSKLIPEKYQKPREDIFHYLLNAKRSNSDEPAYDKQALSTEAILLVIAGADTTSHVLSVLMFYITHYPRVYNKLAKEIRETFQSTEDIVYGTALSSCEYLQACIDESLRISPPGTSEHLRTVLSGGIEVDGEYLPAGTNLGTSMYANGRNQLIYADPNVYRPERWLVGRREWSYY